MNTTMTMGPDMYGGALKIGEKKGFVTVGLHDGLGNEISLWVDPPQIGQFLDMLQAVHDGIAEMPAFDSAEPSVADHASPAAVGASEDTIVAAGAGVRIPTIRYNEQSKAFRTVSDDEVPF